MSAWRMIINNHNWECQKGTCRWAREVPGASRELLAWKMKKCTYLTRASGNQRGSKRINHSQIPVGANHPDPTRILTLWRIRVWMLTMVTCLAKDSRQIPIVSKIRAYLRSSVWWTFSKRRKILKVRIIMIWRSRSKYTKIELMISKSTTPCAKL